MNRRNSSRKEKNVIDQQRQVAAMLAQQRAKQAQKEQKTCSNSSSDNAKRNNSNNSSSSSKEPPLKRPTLNRTGSGQIRPSRRPSASSAISSASALAHLEKARAKAKGVSSTSSSSDASNSTTSSTKRPSTTTTTRIENIKRKSKNAALASLVGNMNASANKCTDNTGEDSSVYATSISPDDFWKNLRDWDLVVDLAVQRQDQQLDQKKPPSRGDRDNNNNNNNSSNNNASSSDPPADTSPKKKPLPDTFISSRHYMSAWAPLCLAEARAQLISEALTLQNRLIAVDVETTWKEGKRDRGTMLHTDLMDVDSCHVKVGTRQRGQEGNRTQFFAHDVCLLVPEQSKDVVERLIRGNSKTLNLSSLESFKKLGLVGHTEVQRKEVNGLILKVSKVYWARVGCKKMYLLRLGGTITSLREFTALCRVDTIPLKKYLLGSHLDQGGGGGGTGVNDNNNGRLKKSNISMPAPKDVLLRKMGGAEALGRGFTDYCAKKFNPSQLNAIASSAEAYGDGGVTLIKGPPGTGKTTTLVAILNALHIRQYNKYYDEVRRIAAMTTGNRQQQLDLARRSKPRLLVCAPSNAAVDNIILKIMEDGFVDGSGKRYNPSMIRVGVGQSSVVRDVALETKVDQIISENLDLGQLESSIAGYRMELQRITADITNCRRRVHAIANASQWPLGKNWEIRVDESSFDETGRVYFVNHKEQTTSYDCPPPPEPGEQQFHARAMPEYRTYMARIVKSVEAYFSVKSNLEQSIIMKGSLQSGSNHYEVRQLLESHVMNAVHVTMTTLGTAGNRVFEGVDKFEVVVIDEAAQSVEPASLSALQVGSRHCVLVGDPQQLPATIFNVSGRNTKYDRSLFQRLEEAGQEIFMLNEQYRMHPKISHFPRHIFYGGTLLDGPNVQNPKYGQPLLGAINSKVANFKPFTVLDLDSREERGGTSLSNSAEAHLAVHLYVWLRDLTGGLTTQSRVAIITPYSQQAALLRRCFGDLLGNNYAKFVEVNTVDAFQGREAKIVIFSAVRAAGSHGIGFLSDVRRMNVALTRAKHFLFVIARCQSVVVNPYWSDLVQHARETKAVVRVPMISPPVRGNKNKKASKPVFGSVHDWKLESPEQQLNSTQQYRSSDPRKDPRKRPSPP